MEALGTPPMPWQRQVAEVAGELAPDTGLPAYREVWLTVPRQSGKTTLILGFEVQRCVGWQSLGPQRVVYSAQTGNDARKKLVEDQFPVLERKAVKQKLGIRRCLKGMGNEAVEFANGSRVVLMASGEEAGHGKTLDLAVIDEAFADADFRREQAVIPAMNTRRYAQILGLSTAGTSASTLLLQKVELGRRMAAEGVRNGIAYFEWSAPDDCNPDDEAVWWSCMPALGHTIGVEAVRHARQTLTEGDFRRAYLNQWTETDERLIPAATWDLVNNPDVAPDGRVVFAVDINLERSAAAIVVADAERRIEVIEHRPGLDWLLPRITEVAANQPTAKWTLDASGSSPTATLLPQLEVLLGGRLDPVKAGELAPACGAFFDGVVDRTVAVRRHPSLDSAVAGADRRTVGDAWAWTRKGSVDIAPLVAATTALWVASKPAPTPSFVNLDDYLED